MWTLLSRSHRFPGSALHFFFELKLTTALAQSILVHTAAAEDVVDLGVILGPCDMLDDVLALRSNSIEADHINGPVVRVDRVSLSPVPDRLSHKVLEACFRCADISDAVPCADLAHASRTSTWLFCVRVLQGLAECGKLFIAVLP